jgi:hypothetical protein
MRERVVIGGRFTGPPASGNGGYSCGAVARFVEGPAEVMLRAPPPLDRPLHVTRSAEGISVHDGDVLVATARPAEIALDAPPEVTLAAAEEAATRYPWRAQHPIPSCFVCSPFRAEGDGLRIFAGKVEGRDVAAAPWRPDASVLDADGFVTPECVWAALDCPSYFGIFAKHGTTPNALLGRLAARIERRPRAHEPCVLVGWCTELDGRKSHVGSALFSAEHGLSAIARGTWVTLEA